MTKREIMKLAEDPEKNPLGLSGYTIYNRMYYRKWSLEHALEVPTMSKRDGGLHARRNPAWNNFHLS
jgi:hypothetical protein